MSELPSGWARTSLGEIATWGSGGTPSRSEPNFYGGSIPWIKSGELNARYVKSTEENITEAAVSGSSAKIFPAGSVAIAMYGATIGKTAILGVDAATNQACAVGAPIEGLTSSEFLYRLLQNEKDAFIEKGKGGAQPNISQAVIKAHEVSLPPLAEQTRIAQKLDELLAQVDTLKARIDGIPALLKRFRQSVLAAAVSGQLTEEWRTIGVSIDNGHVLHHQIKEAHAAEGGHARGNASDPTEEAHDLSPEDLPETWDIAELRDICVPGRPITYGILKPGPELDEGVPYIRVADFPGNKLSMANIKKTSSEIDEQFRRARLIAGDLLLSIRGSVGRLIKIPANLEGANITQDTARLSISPLVSADFVYWALLADSTQRRMKNATRGVAVRGINIGDVRALQIPLPPRAEQTEIVRCVDQLFAFADQLEAKVASAKSRIDHLTQSILAKAFRGELVPQDPNDEPASVLLERIKAQRAAAPKAKRGRQPKQEQAQLL
ncbi:type I restriction enzyme, S subunit [Pseudomonas sp. NFACC19-2]|uniref:restriction endonuclease subunit S n=1 Tax=Ectopseudomonas toyotomiensis TaxID=554344 RepID=UPI000908869F|nr:restriction endonuclease subunit S [Pseudomonas sp. NFACC19-2]SFW48095.1 type I restriction enzyme, S subunit [Pseudomonas sp. NFACC19-2]